MSCSKKDFTINGDKYTLDVEPREVYYPGDKLPKYAHNKPYTITETTVTYWVRPVFKNLWYDACNSYKRVPRCSALDNNYFTGIETSWSDSRSNTENIITCPKSQCKPSVEYPTGTTIPISVVSRSPMCGELDTDFKDKYVRPSSLWKILEKDVEVSGKLSAIKIETSIDCISTIDHYNFVVNHTRRDITGEPDERFFPKKVGVALLTNYCERKDGNTYKIFTENSTCSKLKLVDEKVYDLIIDKLCSGYLLAKEPICKDTCKRKGVNCDLKLVEYCSSLPEIERLNEDNRESCACFMGNKFYKNYYDELNSKFKYPRITSPDHTCFFDYCVESQMKPSYYKEGGYECPNVMTCFQLNKIALDSQGNLKYDIRVDQNIDKCSSIVAKCLSDNDCKQGYTCAPSRECVVKEVLIPQAPNIQVERPAEQVVTAASVGVITSLLIGLFIL